MNLHDDHPLRNELITGQVSTLGRLFRLIRKELSEILRDRRTIMTLVLMPVLLYPLLSLSFQQFLLAHSGPTEKGNKDAIRLGFLSDEDQQQFYKFLGTTLDLPQEQQQKVFNIQPLNPAIHYSERQLKSLLYKGQIDVFVIPHEQAQNVGPNVILEWDIYYLADSQRSQKAYHQIAERLGVVNTSLLMLQPVAKPFKQRPNPVLWATGKSLTRPQEREEFPLGSLVPLILILMTITGAVYPAIDLTAGERERGTLEILVAAPVPRMGLLFAKYVTVMTIAILTAVINLVMMTVTVGSSGMGRLLFGDSGLTPLLILQIFGLLLLFAAFFSALLLTLTSFARSFKEAQAYLIPLMLVSLAPGLAGMIPGVQLSPLLSLVPLLNIVLLGRDLFQGSPDPVLAGVVITSTLMYAVGAIAVAARIFGSEDVLYNEQSTWTELFRRPREPRPAASLANALVCLCLMFSSFFILDGVIGLLVPVEFGNMQTLVVRVIFLMVLSVVLFTGLPLLAAFHRRIQIVSGFLLRPAPILAFLGAILLGVSLWPFVLEILAIFTMFDLTTLRPDQREQLVDQMRQLQTLPLGLLLAAHVIPAITEELFFRGYFFAALRRVSTARTTIIVSALLFALFHLAVTDKFGLERLLPSFLMGLVLGWVCWRSGSVLPAALLHACHNATLVLILYWQGQQPQGSSEEVQLLPWTWLAAGAVGAAAGATLMYFSRKKPKEEIVNVISAEETP